MRFAQLQYLEASIRTGSFRRAAVELRVAQPTISTQVQRLEEDLGLVLLIRGAYGVRPTYAAEQILPHLQAALRAENAMRQEASSIGGLREGLIHMAAVTAASQTILPTLVQRIQTDHPGVHFQVTELGSHDVREGVAEGKFDLGMMTRFQSEPDDGMRYVNLAEGRLVLMVPEDNPLAELDHIRGSDLAGQRVIVYTLPSLNRRAFEYLTEGVEVNPVCYTDSSETATRMARAGVGVTIANTLAVSTRSGHGVVLVPFDEEVSRVVLSIVLRADEQPTPATRLFLQLVRDEPPTLPRNW